MNYTLHDIGALPDPPIFQRLSMRVTEPWRPELNEKESEAIRRIKKAAKKIVRKKDDADESVEKRRKKDEELLEFLGLKKRT